MLLNAEENVGPDYYRFPSHDIGGCMMVRVVADETPSPLTDCQHICLWRLYVGSEVKRFSFLNLI